MFCHSSWQGFAELHAGHLQLQRARCWGAAAGSGGVPLAMAFALLKPSGGGLRVDAAKPTFNHTTGGHQVGVFPTGLALLPWLGVVMGERRPTLDTI